MQHTPHVAVAYMHVDGLPVLFIYRLVWFYYFDKDTWRGTRTFEQDLRMGFLGNINHVVCVCVCVCEPE